MILGFCQWRQQGIAQVQKEFVGKSTIAKLELKNLFRLGSSFDAQTGFPFGSGKDGFRVLQRKKQIRAKARFFGIQEALKSVYKLLRFNRLSVGPLKFGSKTAGDLLRIGFLAATKARVQVSVTPFQKSRMQLIEKVRTT